MNSYIKTILVVLGFFLVFSGLNTVSYKSDVFAASTTLCEANGCVGMQCTTTNVTALKLSLCSSIVVDCKTCVDLSSSGCLCSGSQWCHGENGKYYGQPVQCDVE